MREQSSLADNPDLSFSANFTLACQYTANNMLNDALNIYQIIQQEEKFENAKRLKVNIGNIYFRKKDYVKAVKYYRMALDRIQKVHERTRYYLVE
jgi:intraflagellar transport protein 88